MIFLFPIPVIAGGVVGYVLGRQVFLQCSDVAETWATNKSIVPESTVASVLAAAVFMGSYASGLHQLRLLQSGSRAKNTISTMTSAPGGKTAGSSKPVTKFKDFLREALPVALVHSQALAVSVVFSGFTHGATKGFIAETSEQQDSQKPAPHTPK